MRIIFWRVHVYIFADTYEVEAHADTVGDRARIPVHVDCIEGRVFLFAWRKGDGYLLRIRPIFALFHGDPGSERADDPA